MANYNIIAFLISKFVVFSDKLLKFTLIHSNLNLKRMAYEWIVRLLFNRGASSKIYLKREELLKEIKNWKMILINNNL